MGQPSLESTGFFVVLKGDQKVCGEFDIAGDEVYASEELDTTCISDGALRSSCRLADHYLDWINGNNDFDVMLARALSVGCNL